MYALGSTTDMERHTRIQEVLALLVIQTNPDIPNYLNTPQRNKPRITHSIQDPQPQYYTIIRMKLAIASTTILFAMMAAQAAVLSATSTADVNLVKRAPNGDDDDEQSDMVAKAAITMLDPCSRKHGLCHSNQDPCLEDQGLSSCKNIRAEIAEVKNEFAELEAQLEELIQEYQNHSRKYRVFIKAEYKSNYGLLRSQYLHNQ
ncbi:hypothetical protein BASA62_006051 [Batrachochytrium salamandrivorans]|nr:hypothetical protein BASA62_006051 [Batrachochytrium salamandrivorans]